MTANAAPHATARRRVLAVCLDGYEHALGEELTAAGAMPAFAALRSRSARFLLDHGPASRTGLAGEHVATGLEPAAAARWAAVHFDPDRYEAWQEGTSLPPFANRLRASTVVFDPPYFALDSCADVRGVVSWGAHDPGVARSCRPAALLPELHRRFGDYLAQEWVYGVAWTSPERSLAMGQALARAARLRGDAASWMLAEGVPDWDLALVTVSEPHSAIEGLWHGVDPAHPLHGVPSSAAAGDGVRAVYRAVDGLVGQLTAAFPEAAVVLFAMHGMGANRSDVASMLLLPELLYRSAFREPLFQSPPNVRAHPERVAMLAPGQRWGAWAKTGFPESISAIGATDTSRDRMPWMPASWYAPIWKDMPCFALPSFYDGRIRINLQGREREGKVAIGSHAACIGAIEKLLTACVDPRTGEAAVESVERPATSDPLRLGATESDLVVVWRGAPLALEHPELGLIGPAPYRRTGGHTGASGFAWLAGAGMEPGDRGHRSAFDVVPTLVDLVGEPAVPGVSGRSLRH
jgi:predicted AlkP superfamily phosphohydrolase/phosphomutase